MFRLATRYAGLHFCERLDMWRMSSFIYSVDVILEESSARHFTHLLNTTPRGRLRLAV